MKLFDLSSGPITYRVFLLPGSLELDLSFAPASEFGAGGPKFRLLFGKAVEQAWDPPSPANELFGYAVYHALHARVCIERCRYWQAEYWIRSTPRHVGGGPGFGRDGRTSIARTRAARSRHLTYRFPLDFEHTFEYDELLIPAPPPERDRIVELHPQNTELLIERVQVLHREIAERQRELLETLAQLETREAWVDDGANDMAQWTAMNLDISRWKAERWLGAGRAFAWLPATADALGRGALGIDKVVELARFAEFDDEDALVRWAQGVASGAIRRAGDLRAKERAEQAEHDERARWLQWRYADDGRRFLLDGELPSAQGAVVARALERLGDQIPVTPGEESAAHVGARRADALVALCSARLAGDEDQDRATVVVHADLDVLYDADANAVLEGGPVIGGTTVQRLLCNARVQMVVEQPDASVVGVGRMSREPSAWMMRQLRHRDDGCRFPGCDARRFTQAHHIEWWSRGGATDLDNLTLICSFHHKLVHEYGWSIERTDDGDLVWHRPGGARYRAGPAHEVA